MTGGEARDNVEYFTVDTLVKSFSPFEYVGLSMKEREKKKKNEKNEGEKLEKKTRFSSITRECGYAVGR